MSDEIEVMHRPDAQRYEILRDGQVAGYAAYHPADGYVVLYRTKIEPALEGQGLATRLALGTFEDLRARGLRIEPECEFMAAWVDRNPEFSDLVAPVEAVEQPR